VLTTLGLEKTKVGAEALAAVEAVLVPKLEKLEF